ncbi:MAG: excinuclease ABC subunit UvrA [Candidatus Bruticola sp.]
MALEEIVVKGARENNLKNINLAIPRNKMTVVTGLSGSGKSSLVFDTIYAEGRRRYMESLSSYARQFLGKLDKPDVDSVEGLSPAISIDQKGSSSNPRSTVGTVTEIYDYLRLLYARIGQPHCPQCGQEIFPQTLDQIVDIIFTNPEGTKFNILAPLVRGRKGQYQKLFQNVLSQGLSRIRIDGEIVRLDNEEEIPQLDRYVIHNIEAVVDRIVVKPTARHRIAESVELALKLGEGIILLHNLEGGEQLYSQNSACLECGLSFASLEPRLFSFNSPFGACPDCSGLGFVSEFDINLVIPNKHLSLNEGALAPWGKPVHSLRYHMRETWFWSQMLKLADRGLIDLDCPWCELTPQEQNLTLYGCTAASADIPNFAGALPMLEKRFKETDSESAASELSRFMVSSLCPSCKGTRLKKEALSVTINETNIHELCSKSVIKSLKWLDNLTLSSKNQTIAKPIINELKGRFQFLINVGLDYLSLNRAASTLSGGEAQRIRLATQIGSGLMGVLYILDEPSIGLHQRDNQKLLETLKRLRDIGNTLIVVEHDEDTIRAADHIVDIGPGAGVNGGEVVVSGSFQELLAEPRSLTGAYLRGERSIPLPQQRRPKNRGAIRLYGCRRNNLHSLDAEFPLGMITGVTGVSGSGKSTLVNEVLCKNLSQPEGAALICCDRLEGAEFIDKVINVDQMPIGRTPRSNPATYTGLFDAVRKLFAASPEAKMRGYKPGRFSCNVKGGRCEACQGQGVLKIEMNFLPDVCVPCEVCQGRRYNRETLEVRFKGLTIAEVLDMTIEEGLQFFANYNSISSRLQMLADVGLGYLRLGQSASTLSGGEAQRIKLAGELAKRALGNTLYILDEPTTGLHFEDIAKLMKVLNRLAQAGATIIIIEHNLDVIKCCDWLIDLGPGGGEHGGRLVACGPPEEVAANPNSWTGRFLKPILNV